MTYFVSVGRAHSDFLLKSSVERGERNLANTGTARWPGLILSSISRLDLGTPHMIKCEDLYGFLPMSYDLSDHENRQIQVP